MPCQAASWTGLPVDVQMTGAISSFELLRCHLLADLMTWNVLSDHRY